jgi:GDPmannose 4,6-dehydratase
MTKIALVTGVTGQDGSYLSELLLDKNYTVIGLHRRTSTYNFHRIDHLLNNPQFILEEFDLTDPANILNIIDRYQPDEFYNLAAQSHVQTSFKQPSTTFEINTIGVTNILEAIRARSSATKFYQASTSEMFGRNYTIDHNTNIKYQDENTELLPQSPYGVSKVASHRMVQLYREAYGLFACSGILFNHESPRRGENFVTRKITKYIGRLVSGQTKDTLRLGNLKAQRDWGHAKDYVYAMYLMLQNDSADDFVISTGKTWSVLDFVKSAFETVDLDYKKYVEIDYDLYRPAEVDYLRGNSDKASKILGWKPKISFLNLVQDMVNSDLIVDNHAQKL